MEPKVTFPSRRTISSGRLFLGLVAFLVFDMKGVLDRRFKHLLQSNEAIDRAAARLFVLVKQPTAPFQPQAETVEAVEGRQDADDYQATKHGSPDGHT
jgi:hypothetical protein